MDKQGLARLSGILGLGLIALGGLLYYRDRQAIISGSGLGLYKPGRFQEAPIVNRIVKGKMSTTLRASNNMSIEERIASIQKQIEIGVQDPDMRKLAMKITANCPERDGMCEAKAIYKYVKKHVRYSGDVAPIKFSNGDVVGIDLYQSGKRTIEIGGGDCDDGSVLTATLLSVIGTTARLRVTAESPDVEDSHIYTVALLPKFNPTYAVALDTTLPGNNKFGKEAKAGKITDFDA